VEQRFRRFWGNFRGRTRKRDKALTPVSALWADTSARSAGSFKEFARGSKLASCLGLKTRPGVCFPTTADGYRLFGGILVRMEAFYEQEQ